MTKQYTVEEAYTDNEEVTKYIDGKCVGRMVMSYWEVKGYCSAIEEEGYTKAFDLDKAKEELNEARENFDIAKVNYLEAKENTLIKNFN